MGKRLRTFGQPLHHCQDRAVAIGLDVFERGGKRAAAEIGAGVLQPQMLRKRLGVHAEQALLTRLQRGAGGKRTGELQLPDGIAPGRGPCPVREQLDGFHHQGVPGLGPVLHRPVEPVEVRPPELFFLPAVIAGGGCHQSNGGLICREDRSGGLARHVVQQPLLLRGRWNRRGCFPRFRCRSHGDAPVGGEFEQPVVQFERGEAVVLVVVGDAGEQLRRALGVAVVARFAVVGVGNHGGTGVGHVPCPEVAAHVQRLQLLDAVGPVGEQDAGADHVVQIHQDVLPQELVNGFLAHGVDQGQPSQGCLLIVGVVVDVHARVLPAALRHVIQEILERPAFLRAGMRPEGTKRRPLRLCGGMFHHPEQVLQAPAARLRILPQRIALEIEEDVTGIRGRQRGQGVAGQHPVTQLLFDAVLLIRDCPVGGCAAHLHPGLFPQVPQPWRSVRIRQGSELVDTPDVLSLQLGPPHGAHTAHQQQVPGLLHLLLAVIAAAAGREAAAAEFHRSVVSAVRGGQLQETVPALAEHRHNIGNPVQATLPGPQDEDGIGGGGDAGGHQLIGVCGQLQERRGLGVPGQFGVIDGVGVPTADQEIRAAVKGAVKERCLEYDVGPALKRGNGFTVLALQCNPVHGLRLADFADSAGLSRGPGAELTAEVLQHAVLVHVPELGGLFHQRIGVEHCPLPEPQLFVELAEHLVLAGRGRDQVAGRKDQVRFGGRLRCVDQKHASPCCYVPVPSMAFAARLGLSCGLRTTLTSLRWCCG